MTTVKIKSLALRNFKGIVRLDKSFDTLHETIRARNGAGKTTLMYAWQWALGMDVPDVIPRLYNRELHNLEIKVTAVILINDLEYKLCRTLTEEWKTNRETGVEEKHTNVSAYAIDDVEFAATKYKDKLAQLFCMPYDKLEMLTNKDSFNTDKPPKWTWAARRKELFAISGAEELLKGLVEKSDYDLIRDDLKKGFSTAEIRKAKMKSLKGCTDAKDKNVTLIEDKQADLQKYAAMDFPSLEAQKAGYEAKITELNLTLIKDNGGDKAALKAKIDALIAEQMQLKLADSNKRQRLQNAADNAVIKKQFLVKRGNDLKAQRVDISDIEKRIQEKRLLKWTGNTTCPTCGQTLPDEKLAAARREWENVIAADIRILEERAAKGKTANAETDAELIRLRKEYNALESDESLAVAELDNFEPNPRIVAIDTEIAVLRAQDTETPPDDGREPCHTELLQVKNRLSEIQSQLAYRQIAVDLKARIETLKAENRQLTDQEMVHRAAIRALDAYVSEQVSLMTDSINGKFGGGVSWALFTEQYAGAESELKETCVCMLNSKVYTSLSTGERFRANYEVVSALQAAYGVSLPIFCDNAECYTGGLNSEQERQVILLCASAGEELENCTQIQKETL